MTNRAFKCAGCGLTLSPNDVLGSKKHLVNYWVWINRKEQVGICVRCAPVKARDCQWPIPERVKQLAIQWRRLMHEASNLTVRIAMIRIQEHLGGR